MTDLVPYDQARILLAEAKTVDDVKQIHDKAAAMAEYRRRAGDRTLELDAVEIRMFAERRLGQMLAAQKENEGLNKGRAGAGRPVLRGAETEPPKAEERPDPRPTLAEAGISKKLSSRAQKMAALPPAEFEAKMVRWREESATADRVTVNLLKVGEEDEQRQARRDLATALGDTSHQLTGERKFACVYADPAWRRKAGIGGRAYENHYRTEKWDDVMALPVRDQLQPDAWGFIWIPRAHMLALHPVKYKIAIDDGSIHEVTIATPLIWAIARAWGFDNYSTCFVWTKTDEEHENDIGTGLVVRDQDEILCLFKKGQGLPKPASGEKFGSNHRERSKPLGHSRKPPFYREMIARMVGAASDGSPVPVLELFARFDKTHPLPENWEAWGNESQGESDADTAVVSSNRGQFGHDGAPRPGDPLNGDDRRVDSGRSGQHASPDGADMECGTPGEGIGVARGAGERLEIPQEASGTARKAPGGPSLGGPSAADAAGEAEHSSRLHSFPDPDHSRWADDGGRAAEPELIVKPVGGIFNGRAA